MKQKSNRPVYVVTGEVLDKETLVRLRPYMEDHVREGMKRKFETTKLYSAMNSKKQFDFKLEFYG